MIKKIVALLSFLLITVATPAQKPEPVEWNVSVADENPDNASKKLTATISKGWHLYGTQLPDDGPNATRVIFDLPEGVSMNGPLIPSGTPLSGFDPIFSLNLTWWDNQVEFTQPLTISCHGNREISGTIIYQACNGQTCTPPQKHHFSVTVTNRPPEAPDNQTDSSTATETDAKKTRRNDSSGQITSPTETDTTDIPAKPEYSLWVIFAWGIAGGLIALLTPCIWPMVPVTVGYFLNNHRRKRRAFIDALVYGLAIIAIYLTIGMALTGIFGVGKIYEISTGRWVNVAIAALLMLFAVSFFGGIEITLPSQWSNRVDSKAEKATGIAGIILMALTLAIVSFSCTCPIIGTLLVEAATMGSFTGPAIAMGGFAFALALPFSLFALFPALLKRMPSANARLNSVKIVIGFVELALSLTFLSMADRAYGWGILSRETFLAIWTVICVLLGLYLLDKIRFANDIKLHHLGVTRLLLAIASWSFALYLLAGLWGAPVDAVENIIPPAAQEQTEISGGNIDDNTEDSTNGVDKNRSQQF